MGCKCHGLRCARPIYKLAGSSESLFGQFGPSVAVTGTNDAEMVISAVISTPSKDRQGDIVEPLGCMLDEYALNPVVLLDHGESRMPIATSGFDGALHVFPEKNRVTAKAKFHGETQDSADAYKLISAGVLTGTSIGFMAVDAEPLRSESGFAREGLHIKRWNLLEWSFVAVPANAECRVLARSMLSRGWIDGHRPMSDMMRKALTPMAAKSVSVVGGWKDSERGEWQQDPGDELAEVIGATEDGGETADERIHELWRETLAEKLLIARDHADTAEATQVHPHVLAMGPYAVKNLGALLEMTRAMFSDDFHPPTGEHEKSFELLSEEQPGGTAKELPLNEWRAQCVDHGEHLLSLMNHAVEHGGDHPHVRPSAEYHSACLSEMLDNLGKIGTRHWQDPKERRETLDIMAATSQRGVQDILIKDTLRLLSELFKAPNLSRHFTDDQRKAMRQQYQSVKAMRNAEGARSMVEAAEQDAIVAALRDGLAPVRERLERMNQRLKELTGTAD
jgi:hypothetical protein